MGGPRPPIEPVAGGVRVHLRVTPKASRNGVTGVAEIGGDRLALKVAVTAAPEDGKANAAVVALLAKEWRVAKSSISVVAGGADRTKILLIEGDPAALVLRLTAWAAGLPRARTH